ncbi:MAG: hypothetical protein B6U76_00075 [Desulfurococcales archaeon ex4484_217_2]|nr:MAG: hypothetical protein B6U76_00075 [Desulfurococcales archaeon ex4484_217_2]
MAGFDVEKPGYEGYEYIPTNPVMAVLDGNLQIPVGVGEYTNPENYKKLARWERRNRYNPEGTPAGNPVSIIPLDWSGINQVANTMLTTGAVPRGLLL